MTLEAKVYSLPEASQRIHMDHDNHFYILGRDAESVERIKNILTQEAKDSALLNETDLVTLNSTEYADFAYICESKGKCQVGKLGHGQNGYSYALSKSGRKLPNKGNGKPHNYNLSTLDKLVLMSSTMRAVISDKAIKEVLQSTDNPEEVVKRIREKAARKQELTDDDIVIYIKPSLKNGAVYVAGLEQAKADLERKLAKAQEEAQTVLTKLEEQRLQYLSDYEALEGSLKQEMNSLKGEYEAYKLRTDAEIDERTELLEESLGYLDEAKGQFGVKIENLETPN